MKLGIFVGSFNPVHEGHIKVVNYLLENKYVDKVLLLPTPNYWDKKDLVDVKHRVNMLKFFENDNIIVDDVHNKDPYTYQVLRSLKKDYPNDELCLIIGADNIIKFNQWKNIDEILNSKVIVLNRDNIDVEKYLVNFDRTKFILIPDFTFIKTSSTEIRNGNHEHLNHQVEEYIKKHNLYDEKER